MRLRRWPRSKNSPRRRPSPKCSDQGLTSRQRPGNVIMESANRHRHLSRFPFAILILVGALASTNVRAASEPFVVQTRQIDDLKSVFATVHSTDVVNAR